MTLPIPPSFDLLPTASVELLFVGLLVIGLTMITAVGFVIWLVFQAARLIVSLLTRAVLGPSGPDPARVTSVACPDPVCRCVNPGIARFCRQCGRTLGHRVAVADDVRTAGATL